MHKVMLRRIQNLNGFLSDFLFTLHAQCDAPTYTLTTDQCGARSGSPQSLQCGCITNLYENDSEYTVNKASIKVQLANILSDHQINL